MTFIKYVLLLFSASFSFAMACLILVAAFAVPFAIISGKSNTNQEKQLSSIETFFTVVAIIIATPAAFYLFGFWSSFCYFIYKFYCEKHHVSATWLYWIIALLAAQSPFFAVPRDNDSKGGGSCLLSIVLLILFILPSFYPDITMYLYRWILNPVINFIF